ncbi:hypothetical protein HY384_01440 [Candidatus Daviesbacteria bacterium]|nr:hypothetical protein [Candidatus Daviesbacteria bacterium]
MLAKLLISSSLENIKEKINAILALQSGSLNLNHPDVLYFRTGQKLGVAEARKITRHFSLKPYSAGRAAIIEQAGSLTLEAQNALLKTLEELPKEAIFILAASSDAQILPTVTSRCEIIYLNPQPLVSKYEGDIEKLLGSAPEERFAFIEKLKDREEFFHALLIFFHKDLRLHPKGAPSNILFLKVLLQTEQWARQNVNIRAILEYLMLVMPDKKC